MKTTDRKHKGERPPTERFEHYYTEKPTSSIEVRQAVFKTKGGIEVAFQTPTGVFSFGHIDRASRALVEAFHFRLGSLLDIGCGYGAIGITLKKIYPAIELYMSDINERAVRYAKVNMKNANVAGTVPAVMRPPTYCFWLSPTGPTTTVTPGSSCRVVASANDLKPLRVSDFRNTASATLSRLATSRRFRPAAHPLRLYVKAVGRVAGAVSRGS